ncbi:glycerol-3-phosphate 1-O-acyltransferase [Patulibacter defluvii]|uniref:glycerol-3-phosphate 1-O-acyltransferase n=1 Tax=Patulibacter defluvii TaxID=3095358 RepID=UPI002A75EF6A|nr:glycerol-3-phosphate 1-O-acyltransferase [Patulibacter sp. DM4]
MPTVVLTLDVRGGREREALRAWAGEQHPGAAVIDERDPGLAPLLADADDLLVAPARVSWVPSEADRAGPLDVAARVVARRPSPALQRLLPSRIGPRVAAGAPGTVDELRARFRAEASGSSPADFARFVTQRGALACDRAERSLRGDRFKVPRHVAEQIAGSARFERRLTQLAAALDRPLDEVRREAGACLTELATVQSPLGTELYQAFMRPLHARAWTVEADAEGFARLRALNREHALVFLPTHRSYVDPLVLQQALAANDLPPNHILGGANMSWWPLGPLGRRAGVVFIRRSFGSDAVYKLAIREFLGHLVAKRLNLEWYIEGGRTRTGKLRPPKLGLLRYLAEALEDDRAEDVLLVPVSIVYDRLREAGTMTAEQTGGTKQREDLRWWARYVRSQSLHVGKARIHVGEPFRFREALREAGEGPAQLDKVAFRICDAINAVTPVTSTSLVTLALLGARGTALDVAQIEALSAPLLDYVERRGLRGPVAELRRPAGLRRGLESLVEAGVLLRYDDGTEPVWSIADGRHHVAAFYRNGVLHHVVDRAIVEVALLRLARDGGVAGADAAARGWAEVLALRDLLKFEFFFAEKPRFRERLEQELGLLGGTTDGLDGAAADALLRTAPMLLAERVLGSFVDAQLVVAERLAAREPRRAVEREPFLGECLDVGRQLLLQRRIVHPEALGRESFDAALRLAANRDLVDPGRDELRARRRRWRDEVRALRDDLLALGELDRREADR